MLRSAVFLTRRSARWTVPGLVFAAFVASISYRVAPNHGVLMYGDYPYFWPDHAFDGFSVVQSSFLGYIRLVGMQTAFLVELPRLLSAFLPDTWSSYLLTYGVVYATCLTYYFVAYKVTVSPLIAYVAGLFIILNNVVLEYLVVQPSHIFAALIVYALTFYLCFHTARNGFRARHVLLLGLMSLALTHPFLWALEVALLAGLFLFLIVYERQRVLAGAVCTFTLIALLASFWLIPFAVGSLSSRTAALYAGNEQSVFEGVRAKVHYVEAFDLFQYPGTWQGEIYGGKTPHLFYFAALAFAVAVFLFRGRRSAGRAGFLFLLALYLVSLNLGLGPNSAITGTLWQYAYDHIPGFGFFRTFSRFINLSLVALVFLIVYAFHQLRRDRFRYYPHLLGLFLISLLGSHLVFFTGDLNGTAIAGRAPKEYTSLNATLLNAPTDFSVITYPNIEYEAYRWNANRNQKAFQQITYFKEFFFDQPVIFNRLALNNLNVDNDYFPRLLAYNSVFEFYPSFDDDLNKLDVKYVLIHKDLFDILKVIGDLPNLGSSAEVQELAAVPYVWYVTYFSRSPQYRLVQDNDVFVLYENMAYRPRVRAGGAYFQKLDDTTYRVYLSGVKGERELTLLQRFDRRWRLYPQRAPSRRWCRALSSYAGGLTECARGGGGHGLEAVTRVLANGTLNVPHSAALGYANHWRIDAASIREQFSDEYYSVNPDGSIDAELLIYFRPESYFYLGLVITTLTLAGCLAYLAWYGARRVRRIRTPHP